jgi:hypothetical protein
MLHTLLILVLILKVDFGFGACQPILCDLIPSSPNFAFAELEVKDRMCGEREKVLV